MLGLSTGGQGQKIVLVLGLVVLLTMFCLVFMGRDVVRAQDQNTGESQPSDGGTTPNDDNGNGGGYTPPPMPGQDQDPSSFDPQSWIMGKTGMLVSLAWGVFTVLMVLFILLHSGKMAAGGQIGQVEGKSGIIRVIMALAIGAGGWFITMFIINLF